MPVAVAAYQLWLRDTEGLIQFGASFAVTAGTTGLLKRTTDVERPDHSDDQACPSGHAASAFAAATFMHRRHGFESAWPWYAAATYVGWTRVDANQHRWSDVAGAAAIAPHDIARDTRNSPLVNVRVFRSNLRSRYS